MGKDYGDYEEYNKHQSKYGDKYDGACLPNWLEHREYDGKYKYGKGWKDDNLGGGPKNDYLSGRGGDDTIKGKGGNDALIGGREMTICMAATAAISWSAPVTRSAVRERKK